MRFEEALSWLSRFEFHGIKPGLSRIYRLLKRLGHPERKFSAVHIAGTNGKGSTAAFLEAIIRNHGLKTGLYTSPHLNSICERFVIAGRPISSEKFATYCEVVKKALGSSKATYFELTTALAFLAFAQEGVEIAVIECGLGGRLDATNLVRPEIAIITNIALDHQAYLGDSLKAIAREKAGIIKRGIPLVLGKILDEPRRVILKRARSLKAPVFEYGPDFHARFEGGKIFYQGQKKFFDLEPALRGCFQAGNLALALKGAEILEEKGVLKLEETLVRKGVSSASWPGRFEIFPGQPPLIFDGAHNLNGIEALLSALREEGFDSYNLIFAASDEGGGKPYYEMLKRLLPGARKVFLCEPPGPRRPVTLKEWERWLPAEEINKRFFLCKDPQEALRKALSQDRSPLLITGSLYLIGHLRSKLEIEGKTSGKSSKSG